MLIKKEIQIACTAPDDVPPVMGDYDRLRQLFIIIIENAIKYSPDKTVVNVSIHINNTLEVLIADHGYGISEEELPYVWDRFYKADKSRKGSGTGLGLAIAKHLVQLHRGDISLQSIVGKGTTAIIQLPIHTE